MVAAVLSNEHNAELTVLCVNDDEPARVSRALDNARTIVAEFGSSASTVHPTRSAPAERVIRDAAAVLDADVIVLSTSRKRRFMPALSRRVADNLLRESRVPILFINESSDVSLPDALPDWGKRSNEP